MNQEHLKRQATIVLSIAIIAVLLEAIGVVPGLSLITESFLTYHHKTESGLIIALLFGSLLVLTFGSGRGGRWAVICIGSLLFMSCIGLVKNALLDAPERVKAIWLSGNMLTVVLLYWIVFNALKLKVVNWRDLILSLVVSSLALSYLLLASRLAG